MGDTVHWSDAEREGFIANAVSYWTEIHNGSAAGANRREKANARMVEKLRSRGILEPSLRPLLGDSAAPVRFAAAAYLVNSGAAVEATDVLRALLTEPTLIAGSAAAVMRVHVLK